MRPSNGPLKMGATAVSAVRAIEAANGIRTADTAVALNPPLSALRSPPRVWAG